MFKNLLKDLWKAEKVMMAPHRPWMRSMAFFQPSPICFGAGGFKFFNGTNKTRPFINNFNLFLKGCSHQKRFSSDFVWGSYHSWGGGVESWVFAKLLDNDASMIELYLHNATYAKVRTFSKALKVNKSLQSLIIWNEKIDDAVAQALAEALKENQTLRSLSINKIGDGGIQVLAEALKVNQTLQSLSLRDDNEITDTGAQVLADALKVNQTLQSLDFQNNKIGDKGFQGLAQALMVNKTLQSVTFWENKIGSTGAQTLAEVLKANQTLQSLNLWRNGISDKEACVLAEALKVNQALQSLTIWDNNVQKAGAEALAEALKVNHTLQLLNLSKNRIGNTGTQALAEALKVNQTLQSLNLNRNMVGTAGAHALAEAFKVNMSLRKLSLAHGLIDDAGAIQLAKALANNRAVSGCDLTDNEITDIGAKEFLTMLMRNYSLMKLHLRWFFPTDGLGGPDRDEKISDEVENQIDALTQRNRLLMCDMYEAVKTGDIATVNKYVQQGASLLAIQLTMSPAQPDTWFDFPEICDDEYNTFLHCAVIARQYQMTAHLLQLMQEQRLPLNTRNKDNKTAADLAQGTELETLFPLPQNELSKPLSNFGYGR